MAEPSREAVSRNFFAIDHNGCTVSSIWSRSTRDGVDGSGSVLYNCSPVHTDNAGTFEDYYIDHGFKGPHVGVDIATSLTSWTLTTL